jgi:hypothetical protein
MNGRRNWGIPKKVARFSFIPSDPGSSLPHKRIEVYNPDEEKPFFAVDLKSAAWGATLPMMVSTLLSPIDLHLVQPPLPKGEAERVGTERWWGVVPYLRGKAGVAWGSGGLEGGNWGDDVSFPRVKPWSLGLWWKNVDVCFPQGEAVGEAEDKKGK